MITTTAMQDINIIELKASFTLTFESIKSVYIPYKPCSKLKLYKVKIITNK